MQRCVRWDEMSAVPRAIYILIVRQAVTYAFDTWPTVVFAAVSVCNTCGGTPAVRTRVAARKTVSPRLVDRVLQSTDARRT